MTIRDFGGAAVLAAAVLFLPGCIVQEIRDELKATHHQLESRLSMLEVTNERLAQIQSDLAKTNAELEHVKAELAATNGTMGKVQSRLEVLDTINTSLASLDGSLKTVKNLIEKIPFVGSSTKEEEKPAGPATPDGGKESLPDQLPPTQPK
jgi:septal ring factor EnvC (AmiA/AmiB activator)